MKQAFDGRKRVVTLILALIGVAARRFDLSAEELALLLDVLEAVLVVGLGAHFTGQFAKAKAAAKKAATVTALVLAFGGCNVSTLSGCVVDVSKSDPTRDRLRCEGHEPIKIPRMDPKLRQCVLDGGEP